MIEVVELGHYTLFCNFVVNKDIDDGLLKYQKIKELETYFLMVLPF